MGGRSSTSHRCRSARSYSQCRRYANALPTPGYGTRANIRSTKRAAAKQSSYRTTYKPHYDRGMYT